MPSCSSAEGPTRMQSGDCGGGVRGFEEVAVRGEGTVPWLVRGGVMDGRMASLWLLRIARPAARTLVSLDDWGGYGRRRR